MSRDPYVVAQGLIVEWESLDAIKALREAGVRSILLKGPLQQWWLEPGGPPRASGDVDLLVAHEQIGGAESALGSIGYARAVVLPDEDGREHASVWVAPGRLPVELHWSLVGVDESKIWAVASRETETAALMRESVEIPNEAARCLIITLHAAQHGIGEQVIFRDLERALVVAEPESWRRAFELARAVDGWSAFAGVLSLTERGRTLLAEFGASPPVIGEREALSLLTPAPTSRGFYFLARERGARSKIVFVLRKLVPSPEFMRLRYPLAGKGPVGLLVAYLYRPFWLVRWALPGLRSWQQARRLARASRGDVSDRDHAHGG